MVLQKTKKLLCTAVALFIGVSAISFTPNVLTGIEADAAFEQNAAQLVEDIDFGWNLGNSLDRYVSTYRPKHHGEIQNPHKRLSTELRQAESIQSVYL